MINSISISNYKNLSELHIPAFSQVNLISGKNNVGKSTLLEALQLHINNRCLFPILYFRGELDSDKRPSAHPDDILRANLSAASSLFTGRKWEIGDGREIEINDGSHTVILRLVRYRDVESEADDGAIIKRRMTLLPGAETQAGDVPAIEIFRDGDRHLIPLNIPISQFDFGIHRRDDIGLSTVISSNTDSAVYNPRKWDAITLTEKEDYVIEALRIIEPAIESLAFLESGTHSKRFPIVKVSGTAGRVPLRSMGDGINRILTIILALVNSEGGALLVDEIDNGLHYTVQKRLWEIIFSVAGKLNVQVFATTHSSDCIGSFGKVLAESDNAAMGRYIRLEKRNGVIRPTEYDERELSIVAANNLEIR